jgi:hypothetical protein
VAGLQDPGPLTHPSSSFAKVGSEVVPNEVA